MCSKYRVRFARAKSLKSTPPEVKPGLPHKLDLPHQRRKSRFACLDCKIRHVKCDEQWPVCKRCQLRGTTCHSAVRSSQWQVEVPGLTISASIPSAFSHANNRLLQYWFEKASSIMVIDHNNNPFSFGMLRYLENTESLVYTIQTLSMAHENFFSSASLPVQFFKDRGYALSLVQRELTESDTPAPGCLLTVILLGLASAWACHETGDEFGMRHLHGARAILDTLLAKPGSENDGLLRLTLAVYLGWDQATSFILHRQNQIPLHGAELWRCIQAMRSEFNATLGYAIDMMYILGNVGRYCRAVIDTGCRDPDLEVLLENQLLLYEPMGNDRNSHLVNHAFRKHGLIMLYRALNSAPAPADELFCDESDKEELIQQYTKEILEHIDEIPESNSYHSILAQPLFTAGAQLRMEDEEQRQKVRKNFRRLFSLSRIPDNIRAIEFLEQLWNLRDNGFHVSWLAFWLGKTETFMLC